MPISDDPMHIDNVRARQAADSAERSMYRDIARQVDGPKNTPMGMIRRAFSGQAASDNRPSSGTTGSQT